MYYQSYKIVKRGCYMSIKSHSHDNINPLLSKINKSHERKLKPTKFYISRIIDNLPAEELETLVDSQIKWKSYF